jgi:hypothetical protein
VHSDWARVAFNRKCQVIDSLNARLNEEGIAAVAVDLVGWRMSKVIGNLKHAEDASNSHFFAYTISLT